MLQTAAPCEGRRSNPLPCACGIPQCYSDRCDNMIIGLVMHPGFLLRNCRVKEWNSVCVCVCMLGVTTKVKKNVDHAFLSTSTHVTSHNRSVHALQTAAPREDRRVNNPFPVCVWNPAVLLQ
ncbi:hypothetical protein CEXT_126251 [Caerostris extrusa]|uniref:Uncharacterized protein n=1 Tax=Caerostris extrusa TaxID=172846 RepID=A0AAV4R109_CAEEX|nr:hypothetical protein CEXT_126251 [Caerostris extrusa]